MPNDEALADQAAGDGAGTDFDPARQAAVLDEIFGPDPAARPGAVPFDWRAFLASIPPSNRVRASRAVARAPILRAIEQRELLDMRRHARMRSYQAGAMIAGETDGVTQPRPRDGGTVHLVVTGWCMAIRSHPDGDRVIVEIRGPREIAGLERLALAWGPHPTGPMGELPAWVALGPLETVPLFAFDVRMAVEFSRLPYLEMQPLLAQRVLELEGLALLKLRPTDERLLACSSFACRSVRHAGRQAVPDDAGSAHAGRHGGAGRRDARDDQPGAPQARCKGRPGAPRGPGDAGSVAPAGFLARGAAAYAAAVTDGRASRSPFRRRPS